MSGVTLRGPLETHPFCPAPLPGPAGQWGCSAGQCHDPREGKPHDGVVLPKAEVAHGLAYHHVPLDGQDHQGPQGNFTCKAVSCRSACYLPGLHCLAKEVARKATWGRPGVRPQGGVGLDLENWEGVQGRGLVRQGSGVTLSSVQLELWVHERHINQIRDQEWTGSPAVGFYRRRCSSWGNRPSPC